MTYRVIARVLHERSFLRTELRNQTSRVIGHDKVKWRFDDPGQMEVWIVEYQQGKIVAGLRLSDASMHQHDGREVERQGALRPAVAAAMVDLAGTPAGRVLDPCCGSGTILAEALAAGWETVVGSDIDPEAVDVARANVAAANVAQADARHLHIPDRSVAACVSNLPFGQQFEVQGDMDNWLAQVLAEMARVTVEGGSCRCTGTEHPASCRPGRGQAGRAARYPVARDADLPVALRQAGRATDLIAPPGPGESACTSRAALRRAD